MTIDRWRCCHNCDKTFLACKLITDDGHAPCCRSCDHPPREKEDDATTHSAKAH